MSFIIAATDFSEIAENAVHYACKMAMECNASVMVLHSFIIPITFGETPMPVMPIDEGREIAEARMQQLIVSLHTTYPSLEISSKISFGEMVDSLEDLTDKIKTSLVVIGNRGVDDDMLWLGSNVVSAMRNLRLPVLAVPNGYGYQGTGNICYSCDYKNLENHTIEDLKAITSLTGAKLHILNVSDSEGDARHNEGLQIMLADIQPTFHYMINEDIDAAIQQFIDANQMNWLIVVPHKHSFFEKLFHKSHTKAMIKTSHIPVLALHE